MLITERGGLMFKKKQKEKFVDANYVSVLIDESVILKSSLIEIEKTINDLKAEKDAIKFTHLIYEIENAEDILKRLTEYQKMKGIQISFWSKAEGLLERYKHDVQLLLYNVKWIDES